MLRFSLVFFILSSTVASAQTPRQRVGVELFEKKIRPALIEHCYECHAADSDDLGGGLLLDSRPGWVRGGDTGAAIVPGKPNDSLLLRAMRYQDLEMPPDQKLADEVIDDFRRWIALGAPDPRQSSLDVPSKNETDASDQLWSLQPIVATQPPPVDDDTWPLTAADRFVLRRLEQSGLSPNHDAPPATLIRRLFFDLIGLPPRPDQVAAFVANPSQKHLTEIVDELLASSRFGERWGRHWLDVARYAESAGSSRDVLMPYAWRYRDYVIDAFNRDLPLDQFITEQVAGDLLASSDEVEAERRRIATGLLAIGSKSLNGGNLTYDIIDDQIDVISKSMLGLTVACARCHDHKFDPIPTKDYYSLAGIFLSTDTRYGGGVKRPKNRSEKSELYLTLFDEPADSEIAAIQAAAAEDVARLEKQISASRKRVKRLAADLPDQLRTLVESSEKSVTPSLDLESLDANAAKVVRQYRSAVSLLNERLAAMEETKSRLGDEPQYAVGVQEANKIRDANVLVRGEKNQPGETVKRGFLSAIGEFDQGDDALSIDASQSGRQQFAAWLVHPEHPLTARVAVNRIWQHLMGDGIVETVDNFGASGSTPSHPQLLDFLASRFVHHHGWSTKAMIRQLVLSRTYRMSSDMNEVAFQADPDNRLRWRMPRRRLEAESLRDAMLSVSGLLDVGRPQGSLVQQIGEGEVGRNLDTTVLDKPFDHRSVYLPIIRGIIPEPLKLFDFPEPSNVQGQRDSNTTPTQSLFLMNSDFSLRAADHFATSLLSDPSLDSDADRIRVAWQRCFALSPTDIQKQRDQAFIDEMIQSRPERDVDRKHFAWTAYCQALIASAKFRFID